MNVSHNFLESTRGFEACLSLRVLDLSYNNLQFADDAAIGALVNLRQLLLNDNPLQELPAGEALANLKHLRVLDCKNTRLRNIPREIARLMPPVDANGSRLQPTTKSKLAAVDAVKPSLIDVNLENCPLKPSLRAAYLEGHEALYAYLHRKDVRKQTKQALLKQFVEDLYPFNTVHELSIAAAAIMDNLKDKPEPALKQLVRNLQRLIPPELVDLDVANVRAQVRRFRFELEACCALRSGRALCNDLECLANLMVPATCCQRWFQSHSSTPRWKSSKTSSVPSPPLVLCSYVF